ncbi:MAG: hypothetical protein RIT27_677 [Pseudomonadota bacterium]|jgi:peptidoglycan/xylan/chitin deacetylase (PgdA/CDA1 family)
MINRLLKLSIALFYAIGKTFRNKEKLLVLCYHEIAKDQQSRFVKQLEILNRATKPVFADAPYCEKSSYRRVAVTFDDGFENLLENAFPIMKEKNVPATLFIPTACLGKYPAWLEKTTHENKYERLMSLEQLQRIFENVLIGSHSLTHADLTNSNVNVEHELVESKKQLEKLLNKEISLLAFPYGRSDERARNIAKKVGFKRVFNADPIVEESDFFMGRISVSPDDWQIEFYLKIYGAYAWLPKAILLKKKLKEILNAKF